MSDVELLRITDALSELRPGPNATESEQALYRAILTIAERTDDALSRLVHVVGRELTFGVPDTGDAPASGITGTRGGQSDNLEGHWVTADINDATVFGAGAGGPQTFVHGLNVPVNVNPNGNSLPNVRWPIVYFIHGTKNLAVAPPAAAANPAHNSLYFRVGDVVTADSIQLRLHSNLAAAVNANSPLIVEIFFVRAII